MTELITIFSSYNFFIEHHAQEILQFLIEVIDSNFNI